MNLILQLLLFIFCLSHSVFGLADIKVTWGNGSLNVFNLENSEGAPSEEFKLLETELLIDERISSQILSSSEKSLLLPFDSIERGDTAKLKEKIVSALVDYQPTAKTMEPDSREDGENKKNENDEGPTGLMVFDHQQSLVVSGDEKVIVKKGEIVDNLIVLGGEAQIDGEVKNLILLKGSVKVGATGRVTETVKELAGQLTIAAGGYVTSNKAGVLDNFDISGGLIKGLLDFRGWKLTLSSVLFRLIQTLFIFWLSFRIIPYVNVQLLERKQDWGFSLFMGFLQLFLIPFIFFALVVSILGISLIPIYVCIVYLMGLLGYGLISAILGKTIVDKLSGEARPKSKYIYFFLGFAIWEVLIAAPMIGYLVLFLLIIVSLGLTTTVFLKKESRV